MLRAAVLTALILPAVTNTALSADRGCGSRGGPGYRGPNGRCIGWSSIRSICGDPPTTRCTLEGANAATADAGGLGIKPTKTRKPLPHSATAGNARGDHGLVDHHLARLQLPLNPVVTQETIQATICVPGWTKTIRPPVSYTNRVKIALIRREGLPKELLVDFQLDHRIPLALGGAPSDPRNFQLQPWDEAEKKDTIETCLARAVCSGAITLDQARQRIWRDWREAGKACD